jgi:hypothetical protein
MQDPMQDPMQDVVDRLDVELRRTPDPTFDVLGTVAGGRRVLRRRRLATGAAALAVAAVIGGAAWATGSGGSEARGRVAVEPTADPVPTAASTSSPADVEAFGQKDVLIMADDGTSTLNPDAEVIEQAPFGAGGEMIHVSLGGEEYYVLTMADGSTSTQQLPAQGLTLREWAARNSGGGSIADEDWVEFDVGSHVVARLDGVTVVRQLPDPDLGENFAGPGEPTALAEVVLDGATYFLAVRAIDGGPAEGIFYRRDGDIATLEQFRTFAIAQYAGDGPDGPDGSGGSEGLR